MELAWSLWGSWRGGGVALWLSGQVPRVRWARHVNRGVLLGGALMPANDYLMAGNTVPLACSIIFRPAWLRGLARRHTVQVASFLAGGLLTVALVTGTATHITARAAHHERPAVVPPARVAMAILPGVRLGPDGKLHDAYTPTDLTALAGQKVLVTVYTYSL